jgi:WD40 repeat protein
MRGRVGSGSGSGSGNGIGSGSTSGPYASLRVATAEGETHATAATVVPAEEIELESDVADLTLPLPHGLERSCSDAASALEVASDDDDSGIGGGGGGSGFGTVAPRELFVSPGSRGSRGSRGSIADDSLAGLAHGGGGSGGGGSSSSRAGTAQSLGGGGDLDGLDRDGAGLVSRGAVSVCSAPGAAPTRLVLKCLRDVRAHAAPVTAVLLLPAPWLGGSEDVGGGAASLFAAGSPSGATASLLVSEPLLVVTASLDGTVVVQGVEDGEALPTLRHVDDVPEGGHLKAGKVEGGGAGGGAGGSGSGGSGGQDAGDDAEGLRGEGGSGGGGAGGGALTPVTAMCVLEGTSLVVTGTDNGVVWVWDVATGVLVRQLRGHTAAVRCFGLHVDRSGPGGVARGRGVGESGAGTGAGARAKRGTSSAAAGAKGAPGADGGASASASASASGGGKEPLPTCLDGVRCVSGSADLTMRVWALSQKRPLLHVLRGHTAAVNMVTVLPGSAVVVSASSDQTLRIWDLASGRQRLCMKVSCGGRALAIHHLRSVPLLRPPRFLPPPPPTPGHSLALSLWYCACIGDCVSRTSVRGCLRCVRVASLPPRFPYLCPPPTRPLPQDHFGSVQCVQSVLVAPLGGGKGSALPASASSSVGTPGPGSSGASSTGPSLPLGPAGGGIAGSAGGSAATAAFSGQPHLLSAARDGSIKFWDAAGNCLRTLRGHRGQVSILCLPPLGGPASLARGSAGLSAAVEGAAAYPPPRPTSDFPRHSVGAGAGAVDAGPVVDAAGLGLGQLVGTPPPSHPFGAHSAHRVLSCGSDGVVRLWDFVSGRCMRRYEGHRGAVAAMKWAWPGYAASGGADGAVHVWNVLTGQCVASVDMCQSTHTAGGGGSAAAGDSVVSDSEDGGLGDLTGEEDPDASVAPTIVVEAGSRPLLRRTASPVLGLPPLALASPAPGDRDRAPSALASYGGGGGGAAAAGVTHLDWSGPYLVCVSKVGVVRVLRWVVEVDVL